MFAENTQNQESAVKLPELIAKALVDLSQIFSEVTFVLFGSRSRSNHKKFSDWDIGFISSKKMSHDQLLSFLCQADDFCADLIEEIDFIDLNRVDLEFHRANSQDYKFLLGNRHEFLNFKKKVSHGSRC